MAPPGDQQEVHLGGVDVVEVGQRAHARVGRVDAAVEHDRLAAEFEHAAGTAHLARPLRWTRVCWRAHRHGFSARPRARAVAAWRKQTAGRGEVRARVAAARKTVGPVEIVTDSEE